MKYFIVDQHCYLQLLLQPAAQFFVTFVGRSWCVWVIIYLKCGSGSVFGGTCRCGINKRKSFIKFVMRCKESSVVSVPSASIIPRSLCVSRLLSFGSSGSDSATLQAEHVLPLPRGQFVFCGHFRPHPAMENSFGVLLLGIRFGALSALRPRLQSSSKTSAIFQSRETRGNTRSSATFW